MKIGPYEFLRELGLGGMARVSLCISDEGQLVVVKQPLMDSAEVFKQLVDEANAGKRIHHPNVVETYGLFYHHDMPCIALEYIPGATIHQLRKAKGALPKAVVVRIGRQICEALAAIHNAKDDQGLPLHMLHRDISPSNIILGHDGHARLIDLGIAKSEESESPKTKTGLLRGKVHYFAPELFHEGTYSPSSDLWALCVVLFEALLGRRALKGSQAVIMRKICLGEILELEESEEFEAELYTFFKIVLNTDPEKRIPNALQLAELFKKFEKKYHSSCSLASRISQQWVLHDESPKKALVNNLKASPKSSKLSEDIVPEANHKSLAEILDNEPPSSEESKSLSISLSMFDPSDEDDNSRKKVIDDSEDISLKIARYVQNLDALSSEE